MSYENLVILIGNVGTDITLKAMPNGDSVVNFSLATTKFWKDKQTGEKREKTEWHRVVCFRQTADFVNNYVSKGDKVYVSGELQTRKWQHQDGSDRYTTEIVTNSVRLLGSKKDSQGNASQHPDAGKTQTKLAQDMAEESFGDDIPF
jgi:single-strand DNA-binding protein